MPVRIRQFGSSFLALALGLMMTLGVCHTARAQNDGDPFVINSTGVPELQFAVVEDLIDFVPIQEWGISADESGFRINNLTDTNTPVFIEAQAPDNSFFISDDGSIGFGTNLPGRIGAATTPGRFFNFRSDTTVARAVLQGQLGSQLNMVHLAGPANQKIFRMHVANGAVSFNTVNDALTANVVTNAIVIQMSNGNIGFKKTAPTFPIHMASGAHVTAGGVWTNASSRELKQDIEPITSEQAQEAVKALKPVGYRYKEELDEKYVGFIAEDVPELVATKDRKALAPMDVVAVLTKVVQDQNEQIARQQKQIEEQQRSFESRLSALTKRLEQVEQK